MNEDLKGVTSSGKFNSHNSTIRGELRSKLTTPSHAVAYRNKKGGDIGADVGESHGGTDTMHGGGTFQNKAKMDESQFLCRSSENYFFEIFNKLKKKCPIIIPDTIFVSGGTISSWYFTSKQNGAILKKKFSKLNAIEVFKTLYRQSPISTEEDFNEKKINDYLKNSDSSEEEQQYGGQAEVLAKTINQRNSILMNNTLQLQAMKTMIMKSQSQIDNKEPLSGPQMTLKKIIKEMSMKSINNTSVYKYDETLPYIAFVKFHSQKSKAFKPFEFYSLLHERLGEVKMIQTFIFTRGTQINDNPTINQQSMMSSTFQGTQLVFKGGSFVCEFTHYTQSNPPQYTVYKSEISKELLLSVNREKMRSLNAILNQKIEEKTKIVASYIENTTNTDIKRMNVKFIEDISGEIFMTGILHEIIYLPKGQSEGTVSRQLDDSLIFGGNKIMNDKSKWKSSEILPVCYGEFCEFQFKDSHKFLSYRGKKKEFEKNFSLIPEKNKIFNNKFPFSITALLIKKVQDNYDVALQVLTKHNEKGQSMRDTNSVRKDAQPENDYGLGPGNPSSQTNPSSSKPPKYQKKKLYPDNYNTLYKAVSVCKSCFLIYSILSDYFDELIQATCNQSKTNQSSPNKKWIHSEKLLQKREEKPIAFAHKRMQSQGSAVGMGTAEKGKSQEQFETKKQFIQKNLNDVTIANKRGSSVLKGGMLQLQGSVPLLNNEPLPVVINNRTTLYQTESAFNSTQGFKSSMKQSREGSLMSKTQGSFNFARATQSINMKQNARISYKLVDSNQYQINQQLQSTQKKNINHQRRLINIQGDSGGQGRSSTGFNSIKNADLNGESSGMKRTKTLFEGTDTKLVSLKQTMGIAFKKLFKKHEETFYLQRMKELSENRKLINFFNEVSRDPQKYKIKRASSASHHQRKFSAPISPGELQLTPPPKKGSLLEPDTSQMVEDQNGLPKLPLTMINSVHDSPSVQESPLKAILGGLNKQLSLDVVETKRKTAFSIIENADDNEAPAQGNQLFKSSVSISILKLTKKMIDDHVKQFHSQDTSEVNNTLTPMNQNNRNLMQSQITIGSMNSRRGINKRQNPNITTSVFHHTNLSHIKSVPFYRISTPKAPFYSAEPQNDPDDKYIIPIENYKAMNMEQYAELLKLEYEPLKDCGVFFVDEHTSMIYCVIENSYDEKTMSQGINHYSKPDAIRVNDEQAANSNNQSTPNLLNIDGTSNNNQSTHNQNNAGGNFKFSFLLQNASSQRKKVYTNYIVILDIFDSFTDKIDMFDKIAKESNQPVRFILFNLPGQPYTQYNYKKQILNNSFYSNCIDLLLYHLHEKNLISCLFEPYNLIGFGNGGNIALYYALLVNDTNDNLRSIMIFNGFSYIDQMMKDALNTAIESFMKCPSDLRDFGDFFFHNLIYSTTNLNHDQDMMLNNGASNKLMKKPYDLDFRDKINLCKGVLSNISVKEKLKYLKMPIIYVYSKRNCLVPLKQSDIIKRSAVSAEHQQNINVNFYQQTSSNFTSFGVNPFEQILSSGIQRTVIMIDGAHDVFVENPGKVERILSDYSQIKAPMKFFLMTSVKQSLGITKNKNASKNNQEHSTQKIQPAQ